MFTGIVTDIGEVIGVEDLSSGRQFRIKTTYDPKSIDIGASIACNGVCLTVTDRGVNGNDRWFEVEAWEEALRLTNADQWQTGSKLNLERSMTLGDEFGGHIVAGHVDCAAEIVRIEPEGDARRFFVKIPDGYSRYVAPKGSITLDGTSLTINGVNNDTFDVLIIAHTLAVTTWGVLKQGNKVNFEVDHLARYVVSILEQQGVLPNNDPS